MGEHRHRRRSIAIAIAVALFVGFTGLAASPASAADDPVHTADGTIPVAPAPAIIDTGDAQRSGMRLAPDGKTLYVTDQGTGVLVIDVASRQVRARIPIFAYSNSLDISPDGTRLYVVNFSTNYANAHGTIVVIDTATLATIETLQMPSNPLDIWITPDGTHAVVEMVDYLQITPEPPVTYTSIDLATRKIVGTQPINTSAQPRLSPDSRFAYLPGTTYSGTPESYIDVFDITSATVTNRIELAPSSSMALDLSTDGHTGVIGTATGVDVIDMVGGDVRAIPATNAPYNSVSISDKGTIAANSGPRPQLTLINSSTGEGRYIDLPIWADRVQFVPHTELLVVTDDNYGIYVIDTETDTIISWVPHGDGIYSEYSPDGRHLYQSGLGLVDVDLDTIGWTPTTARIDGADRYDVAVHISQSAFPVSAPVVYVATGTNYPDALSAGPAASAEGGPLLLTDSATLLPDVKAEIQRLSPERIVVVGGPDSISPDVFKQLSGSASDVIRISGADRYEVSRNLAEYVFGTTGAATAYVATGANFPDALSAGPAASSAGGPVILVDGANPSLDKATKHVLAELGVLGIVIAGGPASVSPQLEASLNSVAPTERRGGADRFAASATINSDAFAQSDRAFLATGLKFPDALAGSAWAGQTSAPLYVTPDTCVPVTTLAAMRAQGVNEVTLLGGTSSLTLRVQELTSC